jgi:hypothetical protein
MQQKAEHQIKCNNLNTIAKVFYPEELKEKIVILPNQKPEAQIPSNWWLSGVTKVHPADPDVLGASYYYIFQEVSEIHPNYRHILDMYQTFKDPFVEFKPKAMDRDENFVAPDFIPFDPNKPFGLFYNALNDNEEDNKFKANLYRPDELENIIQNKGRELRNKYADFFNQFPIQAQMKLDNLFIDMRLMNSTLLKNTIDKIDLDQVD